MTGRNVHISDRVMNLSTRRQRGRGHGKMVRGTAAGRPQGFIELRGYRRYTGRQPPRWGVAKW